MTLYTLCVWLHDTELLTRIRESRLVYPSILAGHLMGMALFGGMILLTDLRLLGFALTGWSASEVFRGLQTLKRAGFVLTAGCGLILFSCEAPKYYSNPYFRAKLVLFALIALHAVIFRPIVYRRLYQFNEPLPAKARMAAWLSLLLWVGVVSAGRLIAYWDS